MSKILRDKYIKKRSHKDIILTGPEPELIHKKNMPKYPEITD